MESPPLRIRLFGTLDLRLGDTPLPPLESARAALLLAWLLLHREAPQAREALAFRLWPDSTESQARTNLRHVLHNLRRALPDPSRYLDVTPRTLQWRGDAPSWLDVAAFEAAISRAERADGAVRLAAWQDAVALYQGDLLEGVYDDWLDGERERLRRRYLDALERLIALLEAGGDGAAAIRYAAQLLRHDPLHEEAYRLLMRLHAARGERTRALRVYHVCAATLQRELGVAPSAATRAAYEALLPADAAAVATTAPARHDWPSPLIGRGAEWRRLLDCWYASAAGRAQLALITGEPGIGKSRLVDELRAWCGQRGVATAAARAYPAEGMLAYGPVVAWLRAGAIKPHLARLDRGRRAELARLLPELLPAPPDLAMPAETDRRQRLFDAMATAILAADVPLLLIADDLHWCDRETLQFLHYLLRLAPDARLLALAAARREELDQRHPLHDLLASLQALECVSEIPLGRLDRAETVALAERLAERPLPDAEAARLYDATEGNPLFVVEALRAGWQSGAERGGWLTPKLQAVIESRLAQLSEPARDLAGLAATIGREFTADVLARASETAEASLVRDLDELWRRRIVREQGADAYDFSHDQIREVAYRALSPAQRRRCHLRVASALEHLHGQAPSTVSGQIAAHYERAGGGELAIVWYERAAEAAQQLHANLEAVRLLERARDLLLALPESPERDAHEMAILAAIPAPLGFAEGFTSPRLAAVHRRAFELAASLGGDLPSPLLRSLGIASLTQGDFAGAQRFGERLHARGVAMADDVLVVESAYVLGIAAFWQGAFATARAHFETAVARYHPESRRAHLLHYGLDPKVICQSRLGNTLWFLGQPVAATEARAAALALAEEIGHPFSQSTALVFAALLALEMGDLEGLRQHVAHLTSLQRERQGRPVQVSTEALAGYLDVVDGRPAVGIARIQETLDVSPQTDHAPGMRASNARVLLAACLAAGDDRGGLSAAELLLDMGDVRLWEAEARRQRAECLAVLGTPWAEVAAELARARQVARQQGAPAWELRVASSQLRLQRQHGDEPAAREARQTLRRLLDTLPEGPDSPDARAALALLR